MSVSTVPVWLLDIDGVLAPFPAYGGEPEIWESWLPVVDGERSYAEPILAESVRDFLVDVHERDLTEIRWHTTWQQEAVVIFGPKFGLPAFPVQAAPKFEKRITGIRDLDSWWKSDAAQSVLQEEGRPLVWTDDDLDEDCVRELERDNAVSPMLLIQPNKALGLTPRHLEAIQSFLLRHQ